MKKRFFFLALWPFLFTACVTTTNRPNTPDTPEAPLKPEVSLTKLQTADLLKVNTENAARLIGESDLQGLGPKGSNQEIYLYLTQKDPRSTKMSLIFDATSKNLISAHWYVNGETEADFSTLRRRYPSTKFIYDKNSKKLVEVAVPLRAKARGKPARR